MTLAQRVMVMNKGVAEQIGTRWKCMRSQPAALGELYRQPGHEPAGRAHQR